MKRAFILLVAVGIFMLCASIGYTLIPRFVSIPVPPALEGPQAIPSAAGNTDCMLSIQVDRLDVQRPRLVSAWVTYLYFDQPPYKIDFLPVYFPSMTSDKAKALDRAFALDNRGGPSSGFWRAFSAFKVTCNDYIMIDEYGVVKVLNWINERSDMENELQRNAGDLGAIQGMLEEACDKVTGSAGRPLPPFHWSDLAPGHIRTNLTMDTAMLYWEHTVNAPTPDTCSVAK